MRMRPWLALLCLTVTLSAATGARADDDDDIDLDGGNIESLGLSDLLGMDLEESMGTTDSVSRKTESVLRAPATLTRLDAYNIRLSGATTIPDLLRMAPGVQVFQSGPGKYTVSLRGAGGLSGNNVVVMIDGVRINSPLDGDIDWDLVPLNPADVERIEVVRGPVSSVYGANAYTGVIDIVSRDVVGISPTYAVRVQAGTSIGGEPLGGVSGRILHTGERYSFGLFMSADRDATFATVGMEDDMAGMDDDMAGMDDDMDGGMDGGKGGMKGEILPTNDRVGAMGRLGVELGSSSNLDVTVGSSVSKRAGFDHLALAPTSQARSMVFGAAKVNLGGLPGPLDLVSVWARGTSHSIGDSEASGDHDGSGFKYDGTTGLAGGVGADVGFAVKKLSWGVGANAQADRVNAPYIHPNDNNTTRWGYGIYGNAGLAATDRLDLTASVRGDIPTVTGELAFSYRLASVYHAENWSVRAAVGSAFRAPSYIEVGGRFVDPTTGLIVLEGSPAVDNPTNESVELGAIFSPVSSLTLSPTLYGSRYSDAMVEDFEPLVRKTFRSLHNDRYLVGGELELLWRYRDGFHLRGAASMPWWLDRATIRKAGGLVPTSGSPHQNSLYIVDVRATGTFMVERLGYGVGMRYSSRRHYAVRTGIPPVILDNMVPGAPQVDAALEYRLKRKSNWWGYARMQSNMKSGVVESPLPDAGRLTTRGMVGLELRRE